MARLTIEQIKAPDLSVASEATARAGDAFQRATTTASDLLGQYQAGQEQAGDAQIFQEIAKLKNEDELNAYLATADLANRPMSAEMRDNILNRRDNVLGYGKSRADIGLVNANIGNVNASTDRTRNSTRIDTNADTRIQDDWNYNYKARDDNSKAGALAVGGAVEGRTNGYQEGDPTPRFIKYSNINAIRSRPLAPALVNSMSFLDDMGITMDVISGGQSSKEEGGPRTGSDRHDHGKSADADFYLPDGTKLVASNPAHVEILTEIVQRAKANGVTGFGEGKDYMGDGRVHLGFGAESVWGAGGKGSNAPEWLRAAVNGTVSGVSPTGPSPRTQVTQNPNQGGSAGAALDAYLSDPSINMSAEQRLALSQGNYNAAEQGQAAITAADTLAAEEAAAAAREDIYKNPAVLTDLDVLEAEARNNPGATAVERERNRLTTLGATAEGGPLSTLAAGTTGASSETQSAAASIIAERSADQDRDPFQRAQKEASKFVESPAQSLVTAMEGLDISTTPSEVEGAIQTLALELGITPAEAAYSFARAAEDNKGFNAAGMFTIGGDNLSQKKAEAFAKKNFTGDRATEARQSLADDKLADEAVGQLLKSVDEIERRIQRYKLKDQPVPKELTEKSETAKKILADAVAANFDDK